MVVYTLDHLFRSTSVSFEFCMWALIWEDHAADCCLMSGVVLIYPGYVYCCHVQNGRGLSSKFY